MAPLLLTWADPGAPAVHSLEAFGPVSSVIGYDALADAIRLATLGSGSLVATVATNDAEVARDLVTVIAAHRGRVLVLNREDAHTSTGHGSPVPQLVHGGPGRAGGGEELGGMRSVLHHMQRTAVQGSPNMLTAVTGVWHTGADQYFGEHSFRKSLATLRVGDAVRSELRQVTLADITAFASSSGDTSMRRPMRRLRRRTRSSLGSSPMATCCCPGPPACSSLRSQDLCWPATDWKAPGSSSLWLQGTTLGSR
jgi:oxepin-CoA hydrolase/3-oxo-5,6-dehydrosuberyl-CoA semialdehyde dehydrogenase